MYLILSIFLIGAHMISSNHYTGLLFLIFAVLTFLLDFSKEFTDNTAATSKIKRYIKILAYIVLFITLASSITAQVWLTEITFGESFGMNQKIESALEIIFESYGGVRNGL